MGMLKRIIVISLSVLCVIGLTFYNATKVNTRQLKIREETVNSDKIDEDLDGFLIAFFSDVCYGSFINIDDLNRVVETVNAYKPDMIVFTGDLICITLRRSIRSQDGYRCGILSVWLQDERSVLCYR